MKIKNLLPFKIFYNLLIFSSTSICALNNTPINIPLPIIPLYTSQYLTSYELSVARFNSSLAQFIKERYNDVSYAEHISQNGDDIIDLLASTYSTLELGEDRKVYAYTILKLFDDKYKSWKCKLIDDGVVHQLLTSLPSLLHEYFAPTAFESLDFIKNIMQHQIQNIIPKGNQNISSKNDLPDSFLTDFIAHYKLFLESIEFRSKLRGMVIRFIDRLLSKITWSQNSYESNWSSFLSIADELYKLHESTIIDDEDELDSLKWTLVHGFCNYVDLVGAYLPITFYQEIKRDLTSKVVRFLEEEEQDECITTKKETLRRCLMQAYTKAIAFRKKGIITDRVY